MSDKNNQNEKNIFLQAVKIMQDLDLGEIEMQSGDDYIRLKKPHARSSHSIDYKPNEKPLEKESSSYKGDECFVLAPVVGRVYIAPSENADPFIKLGDKVSQGQVLFIIEAMKVMNEVKATRSGVVKKILVKNENPVEYGQPLVLLE